jgi:hypothetical protein
MKRLKYSKQEKNQEKKTIPPTTHRNNPPPPAYHCCVTLKNLTPQPVSVPPPPPTPPPTPPPRKYPGSLVRNYRTSTKIIDFEAMEDVIIISPEKDNDKNGYFTCCYF